jgi:hypothetical protein
MCRSAVVLAVSGACVPGLEQRPAAQQNFAASSTIPDCNDAMTSVANAVRRTMHQPTLATAGPAQVSLLSGQLALRSRWS